MKSRDAMKAEVSAKAEKLEAMGYLGYLRNK